MAFTPLSQFDAISLALRGDDLEVTLKEMFDLLRSVPAVRDQALIWSDLLVRQAAGPVALDDDVVLPHRRTGEANRIVLSAGRREQGVAFEKKHLHVRLIFLVLTPKERPAEYLQLVAALAARLRIAEVRERLLRTDSAGEFSSVLRG